jgi:hypothetical protein
MYITETLEALTALGNTSNQVAATLQSKGIKGKCLTADACPIAMYINSILPNKTKCRVGGVVINFYDTSFIDSGRFSASIGLTATIAEFISKFDTGSYPELIGE